VIPMRPCPDCHYPAAYDAFGNTDHVCMTGPRAEMVNRMLEAMQPSRPRDGRIIIMESTAAGTGGAFYDMWLRGYDAGTPASLPNPTDR
jgi:hypothetical protein